MVYLPEQTVHPDDMITVDFSDAKYNQGEDIIPACTYTGRYELVPFNIYQLDGIVHVQLANVSNHDINVKSTSYVRLRILFVKK